MGWPSCLAKRFLKFFCTEYKIAYMAIRDFIKLKKKFKCIKIKN